MIIFYIFIEVKGSRCRKSKVACLGLYNLEKAVG